MPETAKVLTSDAEIDAAIRRARVYEKYDRRVLCARYSARTDRVVLSLDNGVTCSIPRMLLQGLSDAAPAALRRIELLGHGTGLYWPALDVAHYVPGVLQGVYGSEKWMTLLSRQRRKLTLVDLNRAAKKQPRVANGGAFEDGHRSRRASSR